MSPTVPSVCFRTVEIDVKHLRKILTSFFGGEHGLFGLILAAPLLAGHFQQNDVLKPDSQPLKLKKGR